MKTYQMSIISAGSISLESTFKQFLKITGGFRNSFQGHRGKEHIIFCRCRRELFLSLFSGALVFVTLGIIFLGTMTEEDTWFDHRLVHSIIVFGKCISIDPVYSVGTSQSHTAKFYAFSYSRWQKIGNTSNSAMKILFSSIVFSAVM
jgi:hypothetical protein